MHPGLSVTESFDQSVHWVLLSIPACCFRYLWYLLREKKFNQEAVDDLVFLKGVFKMSDEDVAAALKERATRIYDKFGTLML